MAVLSKFPFFGPGQRKLRDAAFPAGRGPSSAPAPNPVQAAIANADAVKKKSKASNYLAPQQTLGG